MKRIILAAVLLTACGGKDLLTNKPCTTNLDCDPGSGFVCAQFRDSKGNLIDQKCVN